MSVEQSGPIDYATPTPTAAPGPTVCLILCGGLGLFFAVIGVLGLVANSGLLLASWYFNQPLPEHVRTERMWVLAGLRRHHSGRHLAPPPPPPKAGCEMNTLNLLVLRCRDLEAARAFYESFGLRFTKHAHGSGPDHYAHEDPRGVFELYPATGAADDKTDLGFGAPDLESTHGRLSAAGHAPQPIRQNPWGKTFVVRDPDDRRVEVKEV